MHIFWAYDLILLKSSTSTKLCGSFSINFYKCLLVTHRFLVSFWINAAQHCNTGRSGVCLLLSSCNETMDGWHLARLVWCRVEHIETSTYPLWCTIRMLHLICDPDPDDVWYLLHFFVSMRNKTDIFFAKIQRSLVCNVVLSESRAVHQLDLFIECILKDLPWLILRRGTQWRANHRNGQLTDCLDL